MRWVVHEFAAKSLSLFFLFTNNYTSVQVESEDSHHTWVEAALSIPRTRYCADWHKAHNGMQHWTNNSNKVEETQKAVSRRNIHRRTLQLKNIKMDWRSFVWSDYSGIYPDSCWSILLCEERWAFKILLLLMSSLWENLRHHHRLPSVEDERFRWETCGKLYFFLCSSSKGNATVWIL